MNRKTTIESILFVAGRPVSLKELEKFTGEKREDLEKALHELKTVYENSGIVILEQNKSYLMSTNPENTSIVKDFLSTDLREKLSEASIETLAIVTYKQPVSRAEIESIRGVNSQYTLRLLTMRGLVEKIQSTSDARMHLYRTTHEFMQHMGLNDMKDLPDFAEITAKVTPPEDIAGSVTKQPGTSSIS